MFEVYAILWKGGSPYIKTYVGIDSGSGIVHHALNPRLELGPDGDEIALRQAAEWMVNADVSKVMAIQKIPGLSEMARNAISKDAAAALGSMPALPSKATRPLMAVRMDKESEAHNLFHLWYRSMSPAKP